LKRSNLLVCRCRIVAYPDVSSRVENGQQTKMAKVVVSFVVVLFMFGLYFSPCLAMMTGGISRETSIPDVVKEGVRMYLASITKRHDSAFDYKVKCDKLEASSQVVEGILYRVALEIVPVEEGAIHSDCIHGSDNLRLEKGDVKFVCLTIWSRAWLERKEKRLIVKEVDEPHKRNDVESCLEVNNE